MVRIQYEGEVVQVTDDTARELVDRGLARLVPGESLVLGVGRLKVPIEEAEKVLAAEKPAKKKGGRR